REVIAADPSELLSSYLVSHQTGFGISCTRKITTADEIGDALYSDTKATIGDLQDCIRNVWAVCKRESVVTLNSGAILNMDERVIEFTVTTGGRPFEGAKEAIRELHSLGVPTFIASGDRVTKLEKMADYLGVPRDRVYGVATPTVKAQIVADLQEEYDRVVMVGDGINDLCAMKRADVAVLSEQQPGDKPADLYQAAHYIVKNVRDVVEIVKNLNTV
ncbi:MAG: HAD family hydrolase, partial [Methanomicrobiales archaeon]|nr:HAD family hydrolase [Methanomicrobiales archaeon]